MAVFFGVYVLPSLKADDTWLEGNMPVACYPEIGRLNTGLFLRPTWESRMLPVRKELFLKKWLFFKFVNCYFHKVGFTQVPFHEYF